MMLYPSIMKLMEKTKSRYSLVIATAKRAREIEEAAANETKAVDGARSISKAATEIAEGTVIVFEDTNNKEIKEEAFEA